MKKYNHIILFVLLCVFSLKITAQNTKYEKQKSIKFSYTNVEDVSINKNNVYIKTKDSLYIVSQEGKLKEKKASKEYYDFDKMNAFSIEPGCYKKTIK